MIQFILRFIHARLAYLKTNRQWRCRNLHNETYLRGPSLGLECVTVGKGTFGTINLKMVNPNYHLLIGNYCSIAGNVSFLLGMEHPLGHLSTYPFKVKCIHTAECEALGKGDIIIEDDVWIGEGATILSGVHIGMGGGSSSWCGGGKRRSAVCHCRRCSCEGYPVQV